MPEISRCVHARAVGDRSGFADPAAAIAGGTGYNIALPDAPGAPTRGMVSEADFREYMRQAHQTAGDEVRRAYMQGGMDMHGYYQQTGLRVPSGDPRVLGPAIRATPAQGSGTLPQLPTALPLTNAPVGQTPSRVYAPEPSPEPSPGLAAPPMNAGNISRPLRTQAGQAGAAAAARLLFPQLT